MRVSHIIIPLSTLLCTQALATPFSNGSFESPGVSPGAHVWPDGGAIGAWTVGVPSGSMAEFINGTHVGLAPFDGAQYLSFNGYEQASGAYVYQDFDTIALATYTVSFAVGRLGSDVGSVGIEAAALAGVTPLSSLSASGPATAGGWTTYAFQFTATSTTTRLRFTDISATTNGVDVALDGIDVREAPIVPLPTAAGLGFAGLSALALRRRR